MPRNRFPEDPFASREAEKYENPIPSREFILDCLKKQKKPMPLAAIAKSLKVKKPDALEALRRRLRAMERDGQLLCNRTGSYGLLNKMNLVRGRVEAHRDGFGFVIPDDGSKDLYLAPQQMSRVFHGDTVLASVVNKDKGGRLSGNIVEILVRGVSEVVGRYVVENGVHLVIPEDRHLRHDIIIPAQYTNDCKEGDMVVASITKYPDKHAPATGKITEVIGQHLGPGVEIDVAIRSHQLPYVWPQAALAQAKHLPTTVPESDLEGRKDLRELPFVTIDGEDAKDFDDAVYCEKTPKGGWILYVAIADVSHYVPVGTALDEVAYERGTSVYFPQRVIPMLPEELSNELCSLKANVDRLALVCEVALDADGHVKRFQFYPGVIHSKARLTYTIVAELLTKKNEELETQYERVLPHLHDLHKLYKKLWERREDRHALEFITTETKVKFGENKKIEAIVPVERNVAHRIIEECMLVANVCAAKFAEQNKFPILYRVHEKPTMEKISDLRAFLLSLGFKLPGGKEPTVHHFSEMINEVQDRPEATLVNQVLLRTMNRAQYSPENIGHFGLAYHEYTHFTSPIRRYPDLLLHRMIYWQIDQRNKKTPAPYTLEEMKHLGDQSSLCEQRADEATRDVMLFLKCEYMLDKLGEVYNGVISGVVGFGFFVTLENIWVDGLVHVATLPNDYYTFDPSTQSLGGERAGKKYRLGDKVKVCVARIDLDERKIDLELA